jgi:hypothetical protein
MGVDTATYHVRIGSFVQGNKVERGMVKGQESGSAKVSFIGLVTDIISD